MFKLCSKQPGGAPGSVRKPGGGGSNPSLRIFALGGAEESWSELELWLLILELWDCLLFCCCSLCDWADLAALNSIWGRRGMGVAFPELMTRPSAPISPWLTDTAGEAGLLARESSSEFLELESWESELELESGWILGIRWACVSLFTLGPTPPATPTFILSDIVTNMMKDFNNCWFLQLNFFCVVTNFLSKKDSRVTQAGGFSILAKNSFCIGLSRIWEFFLFTKKSVFWTTRSVQEGFTHPTE